MQGVIVRSLERRLSLGSWWFDCLLRAYARLWDIRKSVLGSVLMSGLVSILGEVGFRIGFCGWEYAVFLQGGAQYFGTGIVFVIFVGHNDARRTIPGL
jgi:hypothetical protein